MFKSSSSKPSSNTYPSNQTIETPRRFRHNLRHPSRPLYNFAWSRRFAYILLAAITALSLSLGSANVSQAFSWRDLIRGGVQVLQGWQLRRMSNEQEMELGGQINQTLLDQEFTIYTNDNIQNYVNQIGQRLTPQSTRPDLTYTFQVVEDEQINAFATMGGFVYVTTGLMQTADNEAELAGVIGHEIGHIEGKHLIDQIWRSAWQQGLLTASGLDRNTAAQIGVELALTRPNSREAERDADERGVRMLGDSGYAQSAMVSFMRKLDEMGGNPPQFLSTHPSSSSRVRDIEGHINAEQRDGDGLDSNAYKAAISPL